MEVSTERAEQACDPLECFLRQLSFIFFFFLSVFPVFLLLPSFFSFSPLSFFVFFFLSSFFLLHSFVCSFFLTLRAFDGVREVDGNVRAVGVVQRVRVDAVRAAREDRRVHEQLGQDLAHLCGRWCQVNADDDNTQSTTHHTQQQRGAAHE